MFLSQFFQSFKMLCLLFGEFKALVGDFVLETLNFLSFLFLKEGFFLVSRGVLDTEKRALIEAKAIPSDVAT